MISKNAWVDWRKLNVLKARYRKLNGGKLFVGNINLHNLEVYQNHYKLASGRNKFVSLSTSKKI